MAKCTWTNVPMSARFHISSTWKSCEFVESGPIKEWKELAYILSNNSNIEDMIRKSCLSPCKSPALEPTRLLRGIAKCKLHKNVIHEQAKETAQAISEDQMIGSPGPPANEVKQRSEVGSIYEGPASSYFWNKIPWSTGPSHVPEPSSIARLYFRAGSPLPGPIVETFVMRTWKI
jgi:hypothetical protein